jgi:hypothetical protein
VTVETERVSASGVVGREVDGDGAADNLVPNALAALLTR